MGFENRGAATAVSEPSRPAATLGKRTSIERRLGEPQRQITHEYQS